MGLARNYVSFYEFIGSHFMIFALCWSRCPLTLLSPSSHPPLTFLSPSSHLPLTFLSPSSHLPLTFLSPHFRQYTCYPNTRIYYVEHYRGSPSRRQQSYPQSKVLSDYLPDPNTFELSDDDVVDDGVMAGSSGRCTEEQRQDNGPYLEVGGARALVEPQPVARQGVNRDSLMDFNHDTLRRSTGAKKLLKRDENVIYCKYHNALGNHYARNCSLKVDGTASTNAIHHQQQPRQYQQDFQQRQTFQQVNVPQPGQITGQVDNQGWIIPAQHQEQQPRTANAVFAPASFAPTPQQGPPSGDPIAKYNTLFTNALFQEHGAHTVSKEAFLATDGDDPSRWIVDSGTSTHMTPHRSVFINFRPCVLPVSIATGDVLYTEGYGDVILRMAGQDSDDYSGSLTLQKVWLAPDLKASLISISALDKEDIGTSVKNKVMTFKWHSESIVGYAAREGEHYWINCSGANLLSRSPSSVFATKHNSPVPISVDLAHRRAYYASENRVRKIESCYNDIKLQKGAWRYLSVCSMHQRERTYAVIWQGEIDHIKARRVHSARRLACRQPVL
ncbi:hypothetical protein N7465_005812 [Penicillium sp. CMV-2018d]|nr:hypothetical protein N7465_005812 [Penicillium sp. CMV-2018d]